MKLWDLKFAGSSVKVFTPTGEFVGEIWQGTYFERKIEQLSAQLRLALIEKYMLERDIKKLFEDHWGH